MKKKPIAVNILYTQTHKKSYPRQQMPTKQATDSSVSFPFTLSHTHAYPTKPLSCKSKELN